MSCISRTLDRLACLINYEQHYLAVVTGRDGSVGAASVGAASLGARREAPLPKRAPSVRSDERPLATQGDMLNSIKVTWSHSDSWYRCTGPRWHRLRANFKYWCVVFNVILIS